MTVLCNKPFGFETTLADPDSRIVEFQSPRPIALLSLVKLHTPDRLWLGVVSRSQPEGTVWRTTLEVEHALTGLPDLLNLAKRFL
ncbi:MAG: hypothetical protein M3Z09_12655 [Acidobacteriota bacterium]|nr:hypothetical protein [Acidobacteriota bacterium]